MFDQKPIAEDTKMAATEHKSLILSQSGKYVRCVRMCVCVCVCGARQCVCVCVCSARSSCVGGPQDAYMHKWLVIIQTGYTRAN